MPIWTASFYNDRQARTPSRIGYLEARTQEEAAEMAIKHVKPEEIRVDVVRTVFGANHRLTPGELLNANEP